MCQNLEEGGMNMIDINTMQDCFLIKWCLKLIVEQKEKWAALPIKNFEKVGKINTFLCDVDLVEFKGLETIPNIFWREALRAWLRHSGAEKFLMVQEQRSSELPIFNNKGIIYQRKSLLLDEAIKKDIFLVKDVLSDENNILSLEQFITKYGIYPRAHLDYFIIMNALKKFLKRRGEMDDIRERAKYALNMKNKQMRKLIEDNYKEIPCGRKLWERKLDCDIFELYVYSLFCTKEVKMKELLFKIFHNIYPTNVILQKIGIKNSNKCDFCQEVDFLDHTLVECVRLRQYWEKVLFFIEKETQIIVPNETKYKLFGFNEVGESNKKVEKSNLLLIIAKFAIIKAKFYQINNIFGIFQSEVKFRKLHKD